MNPQEMTPGQPLWPSRLGAVVDAPPVLWVRGVLPVGRAVAVVGARNAGSDGNAAAAAVAAGLAERGVAVVSGGARGIDAASHRGALEAGGTTVVVLGTGVDVPYPLEHAPLFDEVVARGGAVLSQFPPGTQPSRWTFPARNRVIAGLAEAVVVIEAGSASGALYTAAAANDYGRPVIALLGSPGCDRLAASGALAARDAAEVLLRIDGARVPAPPPPADPRAARLYDALDATPRDLGELAARAGVRPDEALALAIDLELGGLAARAAGGRYHRLTW
ncbi:MAG: DNA-protecting protein DprA [Myxococcales bacterium]|nr:DNA-protecting protein DprA [Myxococcales bacterium]